MCSVRVMDEDTIRDDKLGHVSVVIGETGQFLDQTLANSNSGTVHISHCKIHIHALW